MSEKSFIIIWGILFFSALIIQGIILKLNKNAKFQKKFFPIALAINLAIFLLLPIFQFFPSLLILAFIGFGVLLFFLSIKRTKYCDVCQKFRYNRTFLEKMNFCQVCGNEFI
ncbi:MAG: hypothetical protein LUM44_10695 [Pyrinomonadaceae bacterium]|nr:hypothetical protein [Pyrinomonadaceae bacterium]